MAKAYRLFRACDTVLANIKYPTIVMPKIDGVRGANPHGTLLTRTLKPMPNHFTRNNFSHPCYTGIDGELACGLETDDDLCRKSTSAFMSHNGEPIGVWHAFDLCSPNTVTMKYIDRLELLHKWVNEQHELGNMLDVSLVPYHWVENEEELLAWEDIWLEMGYEGLIQRDPNFRYKEGRSTAKESGYTRRKPYKDTEGVLIDVFEAEENQNEAFIDAQGLTKRSTHQENKVGKGMAGSLLVRVIETGDYERIGPGKLTHAERIDLWERRHEFIENEAIAKFRHFPKGVKVKLRQARFLSWRSEDDILPQENDDE